MVSSPYGEMWRSDERRDIGTECTKTRVCHNTLAMAGRPFCGGRPVATGVGVPKRRVRRTVAWSRRGYG
jgi:hypothetical protein